MGQFEFKTLTNITGGEFIATYGGEEIVLEKDQTVQLPVHIARRLAQRMASRMIVQKENAEYWAEVEKTGKKPHEVTRVINRKSGEEFDALFAEALGQKAVDYSWLTKVEIKQLARKEGIKTRIKGKDISKDELIEALKNANI